MKRVLLVGILFLILSALPQPIYAQTLLAECDACGYCKGQEPPDNWASCARCLYPTIVTDPNALKSVALANNTLVIIATQPDPDNPNNILTNRAVQPAKGRYYTQLGCLNTGALSFRDNPGAAGATVNFILNSLLFPIAGTLAFGTIIYAGFLLLTAQGDQMKIAQGKRMITGSIVGLVFTFGTVFIINIIASDILKIPGFSRGTKITMVGYGQPMDGIYPEVAVRYDDKIITSRKNIQGTETTLVSEVFEIPMIIDLTNPAEYQKLTFTLQNDDNDPINPNVDRNYYNYSLLFDDKVCTQRRLVQSAGGNHLPNNTKLYLNWPPDQAKMYCETLSP